MNDFPNDLCSDGNITARSTGRFESRQWIYDKVTGASIELVLLSLYRIMFVSYKASLMLLGSRHNCHSTAVAVSNLQNGPLQCSMSPRSLGNDSPSQNVPSGGRTLFHHPSEGRFSLLEMSDQFGIYHREFKYSMDGTLDENTGEQQFVCQWSEEIKDLEAKARELAPDVGTMGLREFSEVNVAALYEREGLLSSSSLHAHSNVLGAEKDSLGRAKISLKKKRILQRLFIIY